MSHVLYVQFSLSKPYQLIGKFTNKQDALRQYQKRFYPFPHLILSVATLKRLEKQSNPTIDPRKEHVKMARAAFV